MAGVLAAGDGAVLSHRTAGQLWKILPPSSARLELTRPNAFRQGTAALWHRALLPADELTILDGIPVTSAFRTLFDLAGVLTLRQLERAFNEMEVRGLTDRFSLWDLLERYPGRRGAVNLRAVLSAKAPAGVSRNDFEEDFLALVNAHRLPRPWLNADLFVHGRFFEIDALWDAQRLAVELDGREAHGTARAFESDRERDRLLVADGWRTARVTWRQLRDQPDAIASDLRQMLSRPDVDRGANSRR